MNGLHTSSNNAYNMIEDYLSSIGQEGHFLHGLMVKHGFLLRDHINNYRDHIADLINYDKSFGEMGSVAVQQDYLTKKMHIEDAVRVLQALDVNNEYLDELISSAYDLGTITNFPYVYGEYQLALAEKSTDSVQRNDLYSEALEAFTVSEEFLLQELEAYSNVRSISGGDTEHQARCRIGLYNTYMRQAHITGLGCLYNQQANAMRKGLESFTQGDFEYTQQQVSERALLACLERTQGNREKADEEFESMLREINKLGNDLEVFATGDKQPQDHVENAFLIHDSNIFRFILPELRGIYALFMLDNEPDFAGSLDLQKILAVQNQYIRDTQKYYAGSELDVTSLNVYKLHKLTTGWYYLQGANASDDLKHRNTLIDKAMNYFNEIYYEDSIYGTRAREITTYGAIVTGIRISQHKFPFGLICRK